MQRHSRIGLVLLRSPWDVCGIPAEVAGQVQIDGQTITEQLRKRYDLQGPWVVDNVEAARRCIADLARTDLDLILLAFQTWVEEAAVMALLDMPSPCPLVVWSFLPWRRIPRPSPYSGVLRSTGAVSAFGALGELRNRDLPFLMTWGAVDDPRLLNDLDVAARAARARRLLRQARFGMLPASQPATRPTVVDEQRLLAELGPFVEHISLDDFEHAAAGVSRASLNAYMTDLRAVCEIDRVPEAMLEKGSRLALALAEIARDRRLDLLAVDTFSRELQQRMGIRAGLYPDLTPLEERPPEAVLYQPEADLGAATANYVLSRMTGAQVMFLEFWYWDEALNQIIGGQGGPQDPALGAPGQVWVSRDYGACLDERELGAQIQLLARPGRATIFQLRATPGGWQAIAATGVVLETRPVVEGYPHALLRLDTQIAHFLNRLAEVGATQHWVLGYGSVMHELEAFCQMCQIPLEILGS